MNPTKFAGHTPSPWRVRTRNDISGKVIDCFVAADDVNGFAYDAEILGDDEYCHRSGDIERKLADCELVASAPRLLAENQRLIEALKSIGPRNCGFGESFSWPDYLDAWEKACALLAELETDK